MPRHRDPDDTPEDTTDDDVQDWEAPDESDMDDDDDDGPTLVRCPHCREEISEDAEVCPHCGNFVSSEDAPRRVPLFVLIGLVLVALVALVWILRG